MNSRESVKKKLQTALRLCGFSIRKDLCAHLVDKLIDNGVRIENNDYFNTYLDKITKSLENQNLVEHSIEKKNVDQAIEACFSIGYEKHETIFNVINAFDFPKLDYDLDRRLYYPSINKPSLLGNADSKAELFLQRYNTILQRVKRNFAQKLSERDGVSLKLQTVDYLLTLSYVKLERTLILGSLLMVAAGKYHLEDPTGTVLLDLSHAQYHGGFFVENTFVLVNGYYEDKILHVSTMILPPGEEYEDSRPSFGNLNYFGGSSSVVLKDSVRLKEHLQTGDSMLFFSDVWLDNATVFEKLEVLFEGLQDAPPVAFVFIGDFTQNICSTEILEDLKKLFRQLGELIAKYPQLKASHFVFVPGMNDPCMPYMVPKFPLPSYISDEMKKLIPNALFTTNPCRIQYCTKEITVCRADLMTKFLQGTLWKPKKEELAECLTRTLITQGHLSPLSLNALAVHWEFDYTLRLYPLPDLIVIGDKSDSYQGNYKGCQVVNPGSFCANGFRFKCYSPATDTIDDCVLEVETN